MISCQQEAQAKRTISQLESLGQLLSSAESDKLTFLDESLELIGRSRCGIV